ncbi:hypothetical protein HDU76_005895 [Blyttiomyces sp. JEL0837]|nr:hypothetical protein HDU76_005895 [Blyttiomyces sp. JEL0837]
MKAVAENPMEPIQPIASEFELLILQVCSDGNLTEDGESRPDPDHWEEILDGPQLNQLVKKYSDAVKELYKKQPNLITHVRDYLQGGGILLLSEREFISHIQSVIKNEEFCECGSCKPKAEDPKRRLKGIRKPVKQLSLSTLPSGYKLYREKSGKHKGRLRVFGHPSGRHLSPRNVLTHSQSVISRSEDCDGFCSKESDKDPKRAIKGVQAPEKLPYLICKVDESSEEEMRQQQNNYTVVTNFNDPIREWQRLTYTPAAVTPFALPNTSGAPIGIIQNNLVQNIKGFHSDIGKSVSYKNQKAIKLSLTALDGVNGSQSHAYLTQVNWQPPLIHSHRHPAETSINLRLSPHIPSIDSYILSKQMTQLEEASELINAEVTHGDVKKRKLTVTSSERKATPNLELSTKQKQPIRSLMFINRPLSPPRREMPRITLTYPVSYSTTMEETVEEIDSAVPSPNLSSPELELNYQDDIEFESGTSSHTPSSAQVTAHNQEQVDVKVLTRTTRSAIISGQRLQQTVGTRPQQGTNVRWEVPPRPTVQRQPPQIPNASIRGPQVRYYNYNPEISDPWYESFHYHYEKTNPLRGNAIPGEDNNYFSRIKRLIRVLPSGLIDDDDEGLMPEYTQQGRVFQCPNNGVPRLPQPFPNPRLPQMPHTARRHYYVG